MSEQFVYQQDSRLSSLLKAGKVPALLSLDVFDTLLLRRCALPSDIYLRTAERGAAEGWLQPGISPAAFRELRIRAESRARARSNGRDVDLLQIYACMPTGFAEPARLAAAEVQADAEHLYLNPVMDAWIAEMQRQGVAVVLVSDTYYRDAQLLELLHGAGLAPGRVAAVFSSAEQGVRKADGLFNKLLQRFPQINPQDMLHLGDNRQADLFAARAAGLGAHWYQTDQELEQGFAWEQVRHPGLAGELRSLRRLAGHLGGERNGEALAAYRLGAQVFGPALARFADWAVQCCRREGIETAWGIMREGGLLARLVQRAALSAGPALQVKPVYLSRQSTACAGLQKMDEAGLETLGKRLGFRVLDLFAQLGLATDDPVWGGQMERPLLELMQAAPDENGEQPWEALKQDILKGRLKSAAQQHVERQAGLLRAYLDAMAQPGERVLTLDLGWSGSIHRNLRHLRAGRDIHLLLFGSRRLVNSIQAGLDMRCCYGDMSGGPAAPLIADLFRSAGLLERLLTGSEGTTTAYRQADGRVLPVLADNPQPARDAGLCRELAAGIKDFQALWLQAGFAAWAEDGRVDQDILAILHRLIDLPTPAEAGLLGKLQVELNNGTEVLIPACPPQAVERVRRQGPEQALDLDRHALGATGMLWPQGCITLARPDWLFGMRVRLDGGEGYLAAMLPLARQALVKKFRRLAIYGAGDVGNAFISAARLIGLRPLAVIDGNEQLWGSHLRGLPVDSLRRVLDMQVDAVVICSYAYTRVMAEAVRREAGRQGREVELLLPE